MSLSFAAVFSDHCVLQRNKNITIFGYADDGKAVKVALLAANGSVLCTNTGRAKAGRWEVQLEPQVAQTGCTLTAELCPASSEDKADGAISPSTITLTDIAIGEVWLAGGQSNMEFELQNCTEGPEEMADTKGDGGAKNVRFYYTNKIGWMDDHFFEAERNTCWQTWESQARGSWSAVGFFFAKKLAAELGVTVGLIGCNWGGTSASAWMAREYLEKDQDLRTYLTEQEEATAGKSIEQQCKEYDDYEIENNEWQRKFGEMFAKDNSLTWEAATSILGPCPWPGPKSCKNPYRPTGLYDCMLRRVMPYTMQGVIWYQGESDDHKPAMYRKLFTNMIDNWRTDWHDNTLPFIFVQLPEHRYQADKDFKHWCLIREAQQQVGDTVKNAWMSCALDQGQFSDIHPRAKRVVGQRLEAIAMEKVYGADDKKSLSPMLSSSINIDGKIILTFANAESGFTLHDDTKELEEYKMMEKGQGNEVPEDFTGFEIAGEDCIYYPAKFAFGGRDGALNQIILCSDKVKEPKFARYAWYNYGPVTVFSKEGLPLAPFRTSQKDSLEKAASEHAAIQQIMTV